MSAGYSYHNSIFSCQGEWITRHLRGLPLVPEVNGAKTVTISGKAVTALDTAGALLLNQYANNLQDQGVVCQFESFAPEAMSLLNLVAHNPPDALPTPPKRDGVLELIGRECVSKIKYFFHFFDFIGRLAVVGAGVLRHPRRFHPVSIISTIDQAGCRALPIVGLLCFLIGVVLAYQLGAQLKTYGANIFIVYLTGVAILREFGPLIAAIIMAGRSGSAITAEIGSMKVNQEVDALLTMGLSPFEFLVLPKILGLIIIFPFLILWADIFGVLGSMFMAKVSLGIGYHAFLTQFANSVELKQLFIGLSKAPAFALIIAFVGCYQGFQVEMSADSVGKKTTKSVVQAIFLIIIADAAFSVMYSMLKI